MKRKRFETTLYNETSNPKGIFIVAPLLAVLSSKAKEETPPCETILFLMNIGSLYPFLHSVMQKIRDGGNLTKHFNLNQEYQL